MERSAVRGALVARRVDRGIVLAGDGCSTFRHRRLSKLLDPSTCHIFDNERTTLIPAETCLLPTHDWDNYTDIYNDNLRLFQLNDEIVIMPQRQQTGAAFFIVILVFWLLSPAGDYPGQAGLLISDLAKKRLLRFRDATNISNTTKWGDFAPSHGDKFVNLTGFRKVDGFAWDDLDNFREKGRKISQYAIPEANGKQLWDTAEGEPVWQNASGTLHGEWVYKPGTVSRTYDNYNLSNSVPNMDWIGDKVEWARNITGKSGKMVLRLDGNRTTTQYTQLPKDKAPLSGGRIRNVKATMTLEDTIGSGHTWEMRLWGVHWPRQGVILMTTTSEKFEGIFGLPHLAPGPDYFKSSQSFLNERLTSVIAKKNKTVALDPSLPWMSDVENDPQYLFNPAPQCEFILYAQIHPPNRQDLSIGNRKPEEVDLEALIGLIESELDKPRGAPVGRIPSLEMSAVVYSPDCAFFLESKGPPDFPPGEGHHLRGMKLEVHTHQVKTWLLIFAWIVFGQVYLLKNQMRETFTPSTVGRVSFPTISIMVMVDGITFTAAATWVSSAGSTFLPTLTLMFASFLAMTIGGSFLAKIYEVQFPERQSRQDADSRGGTDRNTPQTTREPSILPAPVTAGLQHRAPSPPVIVPFDGDVEAEVADAAAAVPLNRGEATRTPVLSFQTILGRFILASLLFSFVTLSSSQWYPRARSIYLNLAAFVYLSLWVPQIHRNVMRNCRRALTWQFVIGQSILRLLPIAYFWVKADNFMFATTDRFSFGVLCSWVWLQLFILATQDVIGPRYAIPDSWTPDAWDYHPVLREDNVEKGGLPIGLVADETQPLRRASIDSVVEDASKESMRVIDCSICREILEVPVIKAGEEDKSVTGVFARRMYMVTPCRHIFHTACLESWMKFRLQCPICREDLPPL